MTTDPITRLPSAFETVLVRLCRQRNLARQALTITRTPSLQDFFRIADALGESPVILLTEVITAWRADPADLGLYKSRPSDLTRLYRLGYFHDPADFRELPRVYGQIDQATDAVGSLNASRQAKSLPPLNTICIYVRVGSVAFRPDEEGQS